MPFRTLAPSVFFAKCCSAMLIWVASVSIGQNAYWASVMSQLGYCLSRKLAQHVASSNTAVSYSNTAISYSNTAVSYSNTAVSYSNTAVSYSNTAVFKDASYQLARGGGLGSRPKKMYGQRLRDGVEYHLMSPTPRR